MVVPQDIERRRAVMNYGMSIVFRAIPLVMGAICLALGAYVLMETPHGRVPGAFVAGHVLLYLTSICVALFCTAATIIKQLILPPGKTFHTWMPVLGYVVALFTIYVGWDMIMVEHSAPLFVAGHVVLGLGLISCCVSTVATASLRFIQIPVNSKSTSQARSPQAYSPAQSVIMVLIPICCAIVGLGMGGAVLWKATSAEALVGGHVLAGIGFVCASLVALVVSVLKQINNTYTHGDRILWAQYVLICGLINVCWGLLVLWQLPHPMAVAPGYVLIGLGIVCWSISSKVILLAMVWRHAAPLAKRVPLIPVCTALTCLFIAAFLFQAATGDPAAYAVPARVMVGLGAVCFTLFSIVSILESGTSG